MTPGLFFEPLSWSNDGLPTAYLYTKVIRKEPVGDVEDYPISVVLRKDSIVFYTQTIHDSLTENVEDQGGYDWQYYGASSMLFLPLSKDSAEEAGDILRNIDPLPLNGKYSSTKPVDPDSGLTQESNTFRGLINPRFFVKSRAFSEVSHYSNLPCFMSSASKEEELHLPEVLLDFLFDFFHTNAFYSNRHFTSVRSLLYSHPFLKAIYLKAEYYYYQEILEESGLTTSWIGLPGTRVSKPKKTAQDWLRFLRSADASAIVHPDNKWFEDIESEHRGVYLSYREEKS